MDNKGQSLVEFSVSLVILLLMLAGIAEFGVLFFQYVQLRDAAQEGALYGSICDCPVSDIELRVRAASNSPIDLSDPNVVVAVTDTDSLGNIKNPELACERDALSVRVSFVHKLFTPFLSKMLGRDNIILNAVVTDTVLKPLCP